MYSVHNLLINFRKTTDWFRKINSKKATDDFEASVKPRGVLVKKYNSSDFAYICQELIDDKWNTYNIPGVLLLLQSIMSNYDK